MSQKRAEPYSNEADASTLVLQGVPVYLPIVIK